MRAGYVYRAAVSALFNATLGWAGSPFFSSTAASLSVQQSKLGPVAQSVSDMSATLAAGHLQEPPVTLAAQSYAALVLASHLPPTLGSVVSVPTVGAALSTRFALQTGGWVSYNGSTAPAELGALLRDQAAQPLSGAAAAAWLAGTVPLSDAAMCDAAGLALSTSVVVPQSSACELSVAELASGDAEASSELDSNLNTTDAPASFTAPAWLLQEALAARTGDFFSSAFPLDTLVSLCDGTRAFSSGVLATNASGDSGSPAALQFQFRAQLSGVADSRLPLSASGLTDASGVLASQAFLRSVTTWPGVAIKSLSSVSSVTSQLVGSNASKGDSSLVALPTVTGNATGVLVYVFAVDALGAVGFASVPVVVSPPLSAAASTDAVAVNAFAANLTSASLSPDSVSADPFSALVAAASVASALQAASSSSVAAGGATAGNGSTATLDSLLASNTRIRSTTVAAVGQAVARIASLANSSILVDDATLGLVAGALAALTSDPLELTSSTGLDAIDATASALRYAAPRATSTDVLVSAPTTFPVIIGNTVLGTLVNVQSTATGNASTGGGVPYNVSSSILDSTSALTTAALRASTASSNSSAGTSISMSNAPADAFSGSNFCRQSLSMTVSRVAASAGGSSAASLSLGSPAAPCVSGSPAPVPSQLPPSIVIPASVLTASLQNSSASSSGVDVAVIQWGTSPNNEQAGWSGAPSSLTANGLASRVLSAVLQTPAGDSLATPDLKSAVLVTLPFIYPASVIAASAGNGTILAALSAPRVFVISVPSQAALASGAVGVNSSIVAWQVGSDLAPINVSVVAVNVTPVALPLPNDARGNLPFRRGLSTVSDATTTPLRRLSFTSIGADMPWSWLHESIARLLGVSSSYADFVIPSLHRTLAAILAQAASPSDSGSSDDPDVGSAAWYARWSSRVVGGSKSEPLSLPRQFAADLLRTFVFLTTPHERGAAPLRPSQAAPQDAAPRNLGSTATYWANAYAAVVSVPCGGPAGMQRVTVGGPGLDGSNVSYTCPTIYEVPSCGAWDAKAAAWNLGSCRVAAVLPTAVVCACYSLRYASFATRFSSVATQQRGVFSSAALLGDNSVLATYPTIFLLVGCIAVSAAVNKALSAPLPRPVFILPVRLPHLCRVRPCR